MKDKPLILYEDNHLLIVDKPAGLLTQGDASGRPSLLDNVKAFLKERDGKPGNVFVGMVQRLDKPVSGVLVFAKTSKAASRVSEQIRKRRVKKYYLAVTKSGASAPSPSAELKNGWHEVGHPLIRIGDKTFVDDRGGNSRQALMCLKTLFCGKRCQLHAVYLITGRKHQIRAQFSALGMPIWGDVKYGAEPVPEVQRILLHSYCARLAHPTRTGLVEVFCPLPADMLAPFSQKEQEAIRAILDDTAF